MNITKNGEFFWLRNVLLVVVYIYVQTHAPTYIYYYYYEVTQKTATKGTIHIAGGSGEEEKQENTEK